MSYLADTHAVIWFFQNAPELSVGASNILSNLSESVSVSAVSIYEVEYKIARGQLERLPVSFSSLLAGAGFTVLSLTGRHAELAASLELAHRDPWDRIIAAQAIAEGLTVLTRDPSIQALGAAVRW